MDEQEIKKLIREAVSEELTELIGLNRYTFQKPIEIYDGRHIKLGRMNGTKVGTGSLEKLGFYGATPIARPATVLDPTGGTTTDAQARGAINEIIDRLQALGLIA